MTLAPCYIPWTQRDGCAVAASCLTCPLPACRYEPTPGRKRGQSDRQIQTATRIRDLTAQGHKTRQIAADLNISVRTVFRARAA